MCKSTELIAILKHFGMVYRNTPCKELCYGTVVMYNANKCKDVVKNIVDDLFMTTSWFENNRISTKYLLFTDYLSFLRVLGNNIKILESENIK